MPNPYRGEVSLVVNGEARLMRLSLGALASLETALETGSLVDLVSRFEEGAFSARDLLMLLGAGLGMSVSELSEADIEGGPVAAARAAAQLLKVTFELPTKGPVA